MERSSSSASLRVAGVEMSHMPKRATQHGTYISTQELMPTSLKPGQKELSRKLYTEEAPALGETYLAPDLPQGTVYASMANFVKADHYANPVKPMKPAEAPGGEGHRGTAHWQSEYKSVLSHGAVQGAVHHRQNGPPYQALNPPSCIGDGHKLTAYQDEYGTRGSNPRDRLGANDDRLPVNRTVLNAGSTKATSHIPGYQGFLALNTANPHVARVEKGATVRSVDKAKLTEQFHTNLVGYRGHVPSHAKNDNFGVGLTTSTVYGHSFQARDIGALR